MTEQTNAELIATARTMREQTGDEPKPGSILALWFETAERLEELEARKPEWEYGTSRPEALQAEVDWEPSRKDAEDHVRGCDYGCVVVRRRIIPQEVLSEWELVGEGEDA